MWKITISPKPEQFKTVVVVESIRLGNWFQKIVFSAKRLFKRKPSPHQWNTKGISVVSISPFAKTTLFLRKNYPTFVVYLLCHPDRYISDLLELDVIRSPYNGMSVLLTAVHFIFIQLIISPFISFSFVSSFVFASAAKTMSFFNIILLRLCALLIIPSRISLSTVFLYEFCLE